MLAKVDAALAVDQLRYGKWVFAYHIVQMRGAVGKQQVAVRQDEVETAVRGDVRGDLGDSRAQGGARRYAQGKLRAQAGQQVAKGLFAVRVAAGTVVGIGRRAPRFQVAIVGEGPGLAPQFAGERMGVFRCDAALRGLADVRDDVFRLHGMLLHGGSQRRIDGGQVIRQQGAAATGMIGDAPAVAVLVRASAPLGKTGKGKSQRGRLAAVHCE